MTIEICKYQIRERYHHVQAELSSQFEILLADTEDNDMYEISEEEYKSKESNEQDFYHPLDEINYEELYAELDMIKIHEYKVQWSDKHSFIVHCPPTGINKLEEELTKLNFGFNKDADYPIAKGLYQSYCNRDSTSAVYIPIDEYDELAHLFQSEVDKRKAEEIKKKEEYMSIELDTINLYDQLEECPREFIDVIAISLKKDGSKIKTIEDIKEKRRLLRNLIEVRDDIETAKKIQDFYNAVQASYTKIKSAKDQLAKYENDYLSSRDRLKTAKENHNELIELKVEQAFNSLEEEDKQTADKYKDELAEAKARKERKRLRRRGLIAFAKGVSAAKVDGLEEKYIESSNTVAVQVLEQTEILTRNLKAQKNLDVKTLEGTETLIEGLVTTIDDLVEKVNCGQFPLGSVKLAVTNHINS